MNEPTDVQAARLVRASGKFNNNPNDKRSEFARDLDRFPYNRYWLRLAEITQVYSDGGLAGQAGEQTLQHNRMTHSQKVASVGRRLVDHLRAAHPTVGATAVDSDVVEAACFAHDLGHPPFGHVGETELDRLARRAGLPDGFEGNAQTFRILTALSVHDPRGAPTAGMDLTAATLAACTKYPWARDREADADGYASYRWRKYGCYDADFDTFGRMVEPLLPPGGGKTLEAEIMDWADDISYAVHDVEDFYKAGLIPLDRLLHADRGGAERAYEAVQRQEVDSFRLYATHRLGEQLADPAQAWAAFQEYASGFPEGPYTMRALQDRIMDELASGIITASISATSVAADGGLRVKPEARDLVDVVKQLTWHYVVERADLATQQTGQRRRLRLVFDHWLEVAREAFIAEQEDPLTGKTRPLTKAERWLRRRTLPVRLDEFVQLLAADAKGAALDAAVARGVVDYVASLREREIDQYAATLGQPASIGRVEAAS